MSCNCSKKNLRKKDEEKVKEDFFVGMMCNSFLGKIFPFKFICGIRDIIKWVMIGIVGLIVLFIIMKMLKKKNNPYGQSYGQVPSYGYQQPSYGYQQPYGY